MHFPVKLRNQLPMLSAIVATAVTVSALHGSALIPSSNGTISGCYRTSGGVLNPKGSLRIIDAEAGVACTNNEESLTWNRQSSTGDAPIVQSTQVEVPYGTSNQPVLSIPGFGNLIGACNVSGGDELFRDISFTNTSGKTILSRFPGDGIALPGETSPLSDFGSLPEIFVMTFDEPTLNDANDDFVTITGTSRVQTEAPYNCRFTITAAIAN